MPTPIETLLVEARALATDPTDLASYERLQGFIDRLLGELLVVSGPPPEPVAGISDDVRTAIVRSDTGRPVTTAKTWTTGDLGGCYWRCLLVDTPSVPMGRPIFIPRSRDVLKQEQFTSRDFRAITPYRTQRCIRRVAAAIRALAITEPLGEAAVHMVFGQDRTFIAWRRREPDEPFNRALRGDADNYAKTLLDALQAAGVVPNDRGVIRLSAAKDHPAGWDTPPLPLDEALKTEILARKGRGEALETIRAELRLSRAHMARLLPGEYKLRQPRDPARAAASAHAALELIKSGVPYADARSRTQAGAKLLRPLLVAHLRPRVLEDPALSLQNLAYQIGLDTRTTAKLFAGDNDVAQAFRQRRPKGPVGKKGNPNLNAALDDVLTHNLSPRDAARKHNVLLQSLQARLSRLKKAKRS